MGHSRLMQTASRAENTPQGMAQRAGREAGEALGTNGMGEAPNQGHAPKSGSRHIRVTQAKVPWMSLVRPVRWPLSAQPRRVSSLQVSKPYLLPAVLGTKRSVGSAVGSH